MTMLRKQAVLIAPLALALAGCGGDTEEVADDGEAEATGELLEGTISDDMLPLDEVRSQAPQADPEPDESGASGSSTSASAPQEAAEPSVQPEPGIEVAEPPADSAE